ncbi:hypothetical protein [Phyllobacterium sp. OV277]|jgi:hypothetical protein|uniref:hypothetical protein n=1 Tax=Phyllobacterium sp. OV277 TaxID=1882772 RepID=UPI0008925A05|nr:hypothetical protein [Phyllobacterium sp. OV277]SDP65416.1 hypothetical protein SAMN05443582_107138 [Phyllobacterium sp. OV277]
MLTYEMVWIGTWAVMVIAMVAGAIMYGLHEVDQSQKKTDLRLAAIARELERRATAAE